MLRRSLSRDSAEHRNDGHAEPGQIPLAEYVPRHHLAGGEEIRAGTSVVHDRARVDVHANAEIRERDTGTKRICEVRRRVERARPMRLRRRDAFRAAVVENGAIECAGSNARVEVAHGTLERIRIDLEFGRKRRDAVATERRKDRWHEQSVSLAVEDRIGDLLRSLRDQPSPNGVPLRPDIGSLVGEAHTGAIDNDRERDAVETRDDPSIKLWSARVDCDGMTLRWIADRRHILVEQRPEYASPGVPCAADEKIVRRLAPIIPQPIEVRLKS